MGEKKSKDQQSHKSIRGMSVPKFMTKIPAVVEKFLSEAQMSHDGPGGEDRE